MKLILRKFRTSDSTIHFQPVTLSLVVQINLLALQTDNTERETTAHSEIRFDTKQSLTELSSAQTIPRKKISESVAL